MSEPNYESKWWGYIYDQMMEHLPDLVDSNHRFYHSNLADGPDHFLNVPVAPAYFCFHF